MGRPKPLTHVHLRRAAEAELGGGPGREPRRGDSGPKPGAFQRGFGLEFGPRVAIPSERVRSRRLRRQIPRQERNARPICTNVRMFENTPRTAIYCHISRFATGHPKAQHAICESHGRK